MAATKLLLVEDDSTLVEALKKVFTSNGYEVFATESVEKARHIIDSQKISTVFVDCLLPAQSGIDFVENLRKKYPADVLSVVLMSGIFTDTPFIKDNIRKTQAVGFLKKPFNLEEALQFVSHDSGEDGGSINTSPRRTLYQSFSKGNLTVREKRRLIESLEDIHGFDLPFIYSILVESRVSGYLNIAAPTKEVSGIFLSQGHIVGVDVVDEGTYFGKLLIESGYILKDDLDDLLTNKSTKRIGERLIQSNLLSPHAFNIVLSNQMNIRLSRTIVNSPLRINFAETEVPLTVPSIDSESLIMFLHDWVAGKITGDWLKAHYTQWDLSSISLGPNFVKDHPALRMPLIKNLPKLVEEVGKFETLSKLVESRLYPEEPLYKALHFLLTKGILTFSEPIRKIIPGEAAKLVKKFNLQFEGKNRLEIFDAMVQITNVPESQPDRVLAKFKELIRDVVQPELLAAKASLEAKAQECVTFAKTGNREKLVEQMNRADVELKLKAVGQFEEAKTYLTKSQYVQAFELLNKAIAADPHLSKVKIYLAWVKLGLVEANAKGFTLKDAEMDLLQVSPEDKFDAVYVFVMGLFQRVSGDPAGAKKAFEKAVAMDPALIVARRELSRTIVPKVKKDDVLNRPLSELVGGIFGKKAK